MNKKIILSLLLGTSLVLGACTSKSEEYSTAMDNGKSAFKAGEYEKANSYFKEAYGLEATEDAAEWNNKSIEANREFLIEEAKKNENSGKFDAALENYKKALELSPEDEDLAEIIKTTESKITAQKNLDAYNTWLSKTVEDARVIYENYDELLNNLYYKRVNLVQYNAQLVKLEDSVKVLKDSTNERRVNDEVDDNLQLELVKIFETTENSIFTIKSSIQANPKITYAELYQASDSLRNIYTNITNYQKKVIENAKKNGLIYKKIDPNAEK